MEFSGVQVENPVTIWRSVISTAATITTVILFMTGIQVCRKIVTKGSIGDISGLPFIVGALNCAVWLRYGLLIDDAPLMLVNGIGCLLQVGYTICYYIFAKDSIRIIRQQICLSVATFAIVILFTDYYLENYETRRSTLGLIGCCLTVSFFASPLASLLHVIRTKSTEVLPFYMILTSFAVGGLWFIYGCMLNDNFIKIPNFLGFLLATVQIVPFVVFKTTRTAQKDVDDKKVDSA